MINLIIDILKADANITAITTTSRIYPVSRLEGGVIPAIVVQLTNTDPADTHDNTTNMDAHTVQVSVIEDRPKEAHALAELCRSALDGYSGGVIAECRFINQATDVFESVDLYTQTMLYRVMLTRDNVTLPQALADLGIFELDDVTDVDLDEPLDREGLVYDEATSTWINAGIAKIDFPVYNPDAVLTIAVGTVVSFTGSAQGDRMRVEPFSASSASNPNALVGIAMEAIPPRSPGHVRSYGNVYGVNTAGYPIGTILYASTTAGQLTSTAPTAPNHRIALAVVTKVNANSGRIFVRTYTPAYRLADLSNVASTAPTTGQALVWNGSTWAPGSGGYTPGTPPPGGFQGAVFYQDNAGEFTWENEFKYTTASNTLEVENITGATVTGTGIVKGSNTYGQRYATQAATNRAAANTASITVERYFTVTAEGNGESFNIQSNTPSAGNKIARKIWYKDEAFEATDVDTWTLLHTFAADTAYASTATKWQEYLDGQANGTPPFTLALSWEEVAAVTPILDGYTTDLAFAYALAYLNPSYTGDCIRVRRASDNTEQDIGFDGIDLDTTALTTFCTGTDCFIRTFYDQSGNTRDASQATTSLQPKVYDSVTGVLTFNGKPYIDAKTNNVLPAGTFTISQPFTLFAVARNSAVGERLVHTSTSSLQTISGPYIQLNFGTTLPATTLMDFTGQHLFSALADGSSSYIYQDGASVASGNAGSNALVNPTIFTRTTSTTNGTPYGYAMIFYSVDKSTDRAAIESAINDYYSIY